MATAVLVLWSGMAAAPIAHAHAMFEGATPEPGARLDAGPREIVLRFNEPVTPVAVRLLDASLHDAGKAAAPEADGNDVRLRLGEALSDGQYLVTYRVISEDAHPVAASFEFSVGVPAAGHIAAPATASDAEWTMAGRILRPLALLALLLAAGTALFLALPGAAATAALRTTTMRVAATATSLAVALAVAVFAVSAAEMVGGGPGALLSRDAWAAATRSTLGTSVLVALAGLAVIGVGLRGRGDRGMSRALLIIGPVLVAASRGLTGHPAVTSRAVMLAMAAHVLLAAFWAGALWPLWKSLKSDPASSARALMDRFSRIATPAVLLLAAIGAYMGYVHVGSVKALLNTGYGQLLSTKLAGVALLLGLAAANKLWLTPALVRPGGIAVRRMRQSIGIEMLLMTTVLVLSATLAHTPPPRSVPATRAPAAPAGPLQGMVMEGDYHVMWKLVPAAAGPGPRELTLHIQRHDGTPVDPLGVSASVALPAQRVEPLTVPLARRGPGEYVATVRGMSAAGVWTMSVEALVTDFDKVVFDVPVTLR
jgi:copper transport protein